MKCNRSSKFNILKNEREISLDHLHTCQHLENQKTEYKVLRRSHGRELLLFLGLKLCNLVHTYRGNSDLRI